MFYVFYRTASATTYGQRPKFARAERLATAQGENCAYGPTLMFRHGPHFFAYLNPEDLKEQNRESHL